MRGRKYVVWILVGTIAGTVNVAQGQTQVVPVIVASERYNSDVIHAPGIRGFLRRDDVANTSLHVRTPGRSQVEPQCGSGDREEITESYVDNPRVNCVRVAGSSSLDLDLSTRWIVPRTTLQGADDLRFSPQPSAFLSGEATWVAGSDTFLPTGSRTTVNMDWLPGFREQGGPPAPGGMPSPGGVPSPGLLKEAPVEPVREFVPVWHVAPMLSISERYDSNVFFAPKSSLAGLNVKPDDFVTTVNPQLAVLHSGRLLRGRLVGGAISEFYVQNPDLNYTGFNGQLYMDLGQAVLQVLPRAKSLIITNSILYTPQLPAFFQGGPNFFGIGAAPGQTPDAFGRGIQAFRINTFSNSGSAQASYELSPITTFGFGYTRSDVHFSGTFLGAGSQNQVFDTTFQAINAGPSTRLSPRDVLSPVYSYTEVSQPTLGTYKSHAMSVSWARAISPFLSSRVFGGGTIFEGLSSESTGMPLIKPGSLYPNAGVLLTWMEGGPGTGRQFGGPSMQGMILGSGASPSMVGLASVPLTGGGFLRPGSTTVVLNYSVGTFPSFLVAAGPMLSHVAWIQASRGLTDTLGITGGVNYGRAASVGSGANFSFESLTTNLALNYLITPTLRASVIHTFGKYQQSGVGSAGGGTTEFDRQTGMFTLTYILGDNFLGLGALIPVTQSDSGGLDKR